MPGTSRLQKRIPLIKQCIKLDSRALSHGEGPFSASWRLTILGGALIINIVFQVLATGTLVHPWQRSRSVPRSKPGTCVTQARRLYVSSLANSM